MISLRKEPSSSPRLRSNANENYSTGGSAAAAGSLVKQIGGTLLGYIFMLELDFLKGRDNLGAPVYTLLTGQEKSDS